MAQGGDRVSVSQLCRWFGVPRRTFYYKPTRSEPRINEVLAQRIKQLIEEMPTAGYRTTAWLLGLNKNTVQRIFQLKGWQVRRRKAGKRPRAESMPSVASRPDERWATDMARVWCGQKDRWCSLTLVMDCHTRELLGWRLSRRGNAKAAEAALEEALINRFGSLARLIAPMKLRSDNGLVFCSLKFTGTVRRYGISQEFIQPHTPQQNGMVERLIRTIKEQCIWLHRFDSIDEANRVIGQWVEFYNERRPHQSLGMKTPTEVYQQAA